MHNFCLLKSWNECNTFKMASSKENKVYEAILSLSLGDPYFFPSKYMPGQNHR